MLFSFSPSGSPLISLISSSLIAYLLPSILVKLALSFFYTLFPKTTAKPNHARNAYTIIVISYVIFNLISSTWFTLPTNYYDLLGVTYPLSEVTKLRTQWLKLARIYHPDKLGGSEQAHAQFRILQRANEVLKSDQLRVAYDRFGPELLEKLPSSNTPLSDREIFKRGLFSALGWYSISLVVLCVLPAIRTDGQRKFFWRFSLLALLLSNELCILSSSTIFPYLLPHELIHLLRQLYINFNLLLTHLPIFQPSPIIKPEQKLYNRIAPILAALGMRAQISEKTLEGIVRKQVEQKGNKELMLDKLVDEMSRI